MQSKVITPVVEGLDTLLFIINYENDGGWVLASADKRVPLINARSKTGHFDVDRRPKGEYPLFEAKSLLCARFICFGLLGGSSNIY